MEERALAEIERIEKDVDSRLDRKCVGLSSTEVVFLDTMERCNLSEGYFTEKNSMFDPCWTGCYITPGDITTLRKIHINALKCSVAAHLVYEYSEYRYDRIGIPDDKKEYYMLFAPSLLLK